MSGKSGSEPHEPWATLAEAIAGVRAELSEAMAAGESERLRFDVGQVVMEFSVDVRRDAKASAGVKIWVVEIEGSGGISRNASHRITVALNPLDTATGRSARVGDQVEELPPRRRSG